MGSFKLGKMTLKSLVSTPETVRYPFEEPQHPAAMKGLIGLDMKTCILCGTCEKRCPTGAITVDKKAGTWSINRFACIQCGSCVRECPKDCMEMQPVLVHPATAKSVEVFEKPEPTEEEKAAAAAKAAEKAARAKAAKEARAKREAAKAAAANE